MESISGRVGCADVAVACALLEHQRADPNTVTQGAAARSARKPSTKSRTARTDQTDFGERSLCDRAVHGVVHGIAIALPASICATNPRRTGDLRCGCAQFLVAPTPQSLPQGAYVHPRRRQSSVRRGNCGKTPTFLTEPPLRRRPRPKGAYGDAFDGSRKVWATMAFNLATAGLWFHGAMRSVVLSGSICRPQD